MNVKEAIKKRRTIRKFEQKPLSEEQVKNYIDSARIAPSGGNLQPLRYTAIISGEMVKKAFPLFKWAAYLAPDYNPKENERPTAYIVILSDKNIRPSGCELDAGAAAENIILSALEDGVGSCWIGSIDRAGLRELLSLPENLEIVSVIALGYPAESPKEAVIKDGDIKYYLDDENVLNVPKLSLEGIICDII